ncbi:MAG: hypothetical protein WBX00_24315 [Isosphaeraceae bacterium]
MWPGNTAHVTTLIPVVDRLRSRSGISKVCIVADRSMISKETIEALEKEERGWQYIPGVRMRSQNEVKDEVLARLVAIGSCIPSARPARTRRR